MAECFKLKGHTADVTKILHWEPTIKPKNGVYLGVELELDIDYGKVTEVQAQPYINCQCVDCTYNERYNGIDKAQKRAKLSYVAIETQKYLKDFCIFKHDGSVHGFEIVSLPLGLAGHRRRWKPFFENIELALQANENDGMHVHFSKAPFSGAKGRQRLHFISQFVNGVSSHKTEEFITKLAGRHFGTYCKKINKNLNMIGREELGIGKYESVNFLPEYTAEVRIFASTKTYEIFMYRLEFVAAITDYVLNEVDVLTPDYSLEKFCAYVRKNGTVIYKNLIGFLDKKGY